MEIEVREAVMRRDRRCVLSFLEDDHQCRDVFGNAHEPTEIWRLTLEHVKPELMMARRGPSEERWMVALCGAANIRPPTKDQRFLMREYLTASYPESPPQRRAG